MSLYLGVERHLLIRIRSSAEKKDGVSAFTLSLTVSAMTLRSHPLMVGESA